ncbi:rRNA maturation RNase YbeY [Brevundimonas sp. S30B]|uniref:rRNA maturation RNase YbeY n=1 Tax=unclassified Brevundimonas TaxID=2622653 RepID=UPI001072B47E|nr:MULTISPECIES: rRNA maturation RNase YbeY [unclassified Brevundimonas]QBX37160.1 rRNA maturation RNase YbeY [Brevundimonas sp. MF30-B]TFW04045.1 rRNA maturation RNase YbeY [Brevundimonas sp. S30B]
MIEIEVEDEAWRAIGAVEAVVERAAQAALGTVEGDIVVLLTDDAAVAEINGRFRDKDRPTNVLSFPAPDSARPHLGDLILASGVCAVEAAAQGKALADHLTHLTVHGVLHLLGRDHEDDAEAEAMEAEERTILAALGVADPYALEPD